MQEIMSEVCVKKRHDITTEEGESNQIRGIEHIARH